MNSIETMKSRIEALPDHDSEQIRIAHEQLKNLEFSFNLGNMEIDLFSMSKNDVLTLIDDIAGMDFQLLLATRNIEPEYREGSDKEAWAAMARESRIRLLVHEFTLLSRLRSDEPEAWDEVNELFFDD
ncbi:MAG: hypothetical protein JXB03_07085 [Spirochaetales bacterium]|nr:hypothetical protein [Spirochaetales bacterium]